jgi:hypothetical protein
MIKLKNPLMLMALMLAGLVAALSSCTDIPDESPEAVRVSFTMSDRSAGASNSNRQLSRTAYGRYELTDDSVSVAYVFEKPVFDAEKDLGGTLYEKDVKTFISLAYSSGTYTHEVGGDGVRMYDGTVEGLKVPLNTELIVYVIAWEGAAETSDANFGYMTESFTVTDGQTEASVLVEGGDWELGGGSSSRPSSIKAFVIDNLTVNNGTSTSNLEILQWEDNPIHGFSILHSAEGYGSFLKDSLNLSASCTASDDIHLQNSDNSSCINITTSSMSYGYPLQSQRSEFTYIDLFRVDKALEPTKTYYISFKHNIIKNNAKGNFSGSDNGSYYTFEINLNNLSQVTDQASNNGYYLWTDEWIKAP